MKPHSRAGSLLRSFRFRLTLWFVAILAAIIAIFSLFIYFRQVQVLRNEAVTRLTAQSVQFSVFYKTLSGRTPASEQEEGDDDFSISDDNFIFMQEDEVSAILGETGQVLQTSEHLSPAIASVVYTQWAAGPDRSAAVEYAYAENGASRAFLFLITPAELEHDLHILLMLGSPLDPGGQMSRLALALAAIFGATILVAFGGGYWLANQAMRPVQEITRTARDLGERDLNRRLNLNRRDELGALADTFDDMLARLQDAFERRRQFTADASHELRTPLAIIELEANRMLERPRSQSEYEAALKTIQTENEWMSRLVNELLLLARMDAGISTGRSEALDLGDVTLDTVERLGTLAEHHNVRLSTGAFGEAPVLADRSLINQMLTNLVENGIKYSRTAGGEVKLETGQAEHAGKRWSWLAVSDNGPGIPQDHLPHLFDRFYRVDEARARAETTSSQAGETTGSGLGLAIVQSIVDAFEGRIEVDSSPGNGTTFTVFFPAPVQPGIGTQFFPSRSP